jgi:hypothetical protein
MDLPHLLEWNLFNSWCCANIGTDMDGILCHNPPRQSESLYLCRRTPVREIITARHEKERAGTVQWLGDHRVRYGKLSMWPWSTESRRDLHRVAAWKARSVRASGLEWYVESEPAMADAIREHGIRVLCPEQGELR